MSAGAARLPLAVPAWRRTLPAALAALALGAAIATLPTMQAAALLVAALVVPVVLTRPLLALCLAVAAIPLSSEWGIGLGGLNLTLMEPAVGLAVAAWALAGARRRSLRVWPSALLSVQLLMLALFLASSLGGESRVLSLKDTIKWLELVVVFVLTVDQAREVRAARLLLLALVGAAALEATYGAFQFLTGRGPAFFAIGPFMRAHGHFGQPNPFAGYLSTALPLALALGFLAREGALRWAWPAAALLAGGVGLSFSRGAWLGIATAGIAMLAAASERSRRLLAPLAAALLLLAVLGTLGLLPSVVADRLGIVAEYFGPFDVRTVAVTPENWSVVERMAHWQAAWYMFLDHPWTGVGPANYGIAYEDYFLPGWPDPLGHAHNYYLNLAAETGVFGLGAFLLTLVLGFRAAIRGLRAPEPFWRAIAVGVLGALVAVAVHSSFDNVFVHGVSVQVGALLGLAQVASSSRDDRVE